MRVSRLILECALTTAFAAFAAFAGCGGKVIIDEGEQRTGQGGSSSASVTGTGQTSTVTVGPSSVTASGSGGGDLKSNCQVVCEHVEEAGCMVQGCFEDCIQTFASAGDCADEFAALVACDAEHLDELNQCSTPAACEPLTDAFTSCQSNEGCGPQSCAEDGSGTCSCEVQCGGSTFSSECSLTPGGQACSCSVDGQPVGKCVGANTCDLFGGCCGALLFGQN